jgi:hypothetical protein
MRSDRSNRADTTDLAVAVAKNSVISASILDGSIGLIDIGQNGATSGQVIKWNGSGWVASNDEGSGTVGSGWTDDGTNVHLTTSNENVGIGTTTPSQKLEVSGIIYSTVGFEFPDGTVQSTAGNGNFLPISGGTMSGPIRSVGDPLITMGKGNFGNANTNSGIQSFVAGSHNSADGDFSVVSGGGGLGIGDSNRALAHHATVGGGSGNKATFPWSTIGGGANNLATAFSTTVAGGSGNRATATGATIPGGFSNEAAGDGSFAAGEKAHAIQGGSMVLSGTPHNGTGQDIFSGGTGQMVLRADGGMYVTNRGGTAPYDTSRLINTSAGAYLTTSGSLVVPGLIQSTGAGFRFPDGTSQTTAAAGGNSGWSDDGNAVRLVTTTDNVGIGTSTPSRKLEVAGSAKVSDTLFANAVSSSNAPLAIQAAGTTRMFVTNTTGNVGIGTVAPTEALEVSGTAKSTSFVLSGLGSASTPAVRMAADPSTGIYFPGVTQVSVSTAGVARLNVTPSSVSVTTPLSVTGNTTVAGSLTVGGGTPIVKVVSVTAVLDFPSTSAQTSRDTTISVSGAAIGDAVSLGVPPTSMTTNCSYMAWVPVANNVTVRFINSSTGALNPASGIFRVAVMKF